jgi:hypothetical protein
MGLVGVLRDQFWDLEAPSPCGRPNFSFLKKNVFFEEKILTQFGPKRT